MKIAAVLTIALGFVVAPYLGFAAMQANAAHAAHTPHASCVAAAVSNIPCPPQESAFDFVSFHLNAMRTLFATHGALTLSLLVLGALAAWCLHRIRTLLHEQHAATNDWHTQIVRARSSPFKERLISWLGLRYRLDHAVAHL